MSILAELRRRNVFRVAAAYVVVSWLIIQVASAVSAPLNLPEWFETVVVVMLAIGFPIALLLAWAFDLTPDGVKVTQPDVAETRDDGVSKLDIALIAALALVAVATLWGKVALGPEGSGSRTALVANDSSIAVLPFADMSPDGDQEYFGDGIAEELLNELTGLDGLRVAGRTSSFSYKNTNDDLQTIGNALNVSSILEGSVRKDGDRVRITAQLISVENGYHLWSDTYDRELTDIFAIQEEISAEVAGALGVRLGVGSVNAFHGAGTTSVEAYETYLRGIQVQGLASKDRIRLFERAIEHDPNYAAAHAALGLTIAGTMWRNSPQDAPAILDRAIPILYRAIELDPDSAYANTLLATANYARLDWIQSEEYYLKALSLLPDRDNLHNYANMLMRAGRSTSAQSNYSLSDDAERIPPQPSNLRMNADLAQSRYSVAKATAGRFSGTGRLEADLMIALNEAETNAVKAALAAFPVTDIRTEKLHTSVLNVLDSPNDALLVLQAIYADEENSWPSMHHDVALLAAYFGFPEFALQVFSEEARYTTVRLGALWYPVMAEVRQLAEFRELATEINLVEYWRKYGWADHCRPLAENDFVCN